MSDYLIRGMDETGRIRMLVSTTTEAVEKARLTHGSSATATAAIGRSLTAAVMMGNMMKNDKDMMTLRIFGNGSIGNIVMVSDKNGTVKGYADNPRADIASKNGKLDVAGIVGTDGAVSVTMDLGMKEPYVGQAALMTGEIAEDIAYYYAISEQQPSAVGLGVLVNKDLSVKAAGGFIIQLMPGVSDEDIDRIEEILNEMEPISALIDRGLSPEEIMDEILGEMGMKILDKLDLEYKCDCSKDRVENVLYRVDLEELEDMKAEDKGAEITCHFCNKVYNFGEEDLEKIIFDKKRE